MSVVVVVCLPTPLCFLWIHGGREREVGSLYWHTSVTELFSSHHHHQCTHCVSSTVSSGPVLFLCYHQSQNLNFCIHMFECVLVMFGCSRKLVVGDHICGEAAVIVVISVGGGGGVWGQPGHQRCQSQYYPHSHQCDLWLVHNSDGFIQPFISDSTTKWKQNLSFGTLVQLSHPRTGENWMRISRSRLI